MNTQWQNQIVQEPCLRQGIEVEFSVPICTTPPQSNSDPDTHQVPWPTSAFAYGFSLRKQVILRRFLNDIQLRFVRHVDSLPPGATLLLWGSRPIPTGLAHDVHIIRVEDGFIRSVGLGADLVRPLSWVFDRRGMHYDAQHPSDLEHLLQTSVFTPELLQRAALLRHRIVTHQLTKYNIGVMHWHRPVGIKKVILVPGQVQSDAAMRLGTPGITTNIGLLQAVRAAHPNAYIIYKPHPDVVAGLRAQGLDEAQASTWCDVIVIDVAMGSLLDTVDEVHVLTSLTGFEALLRNKPVTCYGQPFYAGWGLTEDQSGAPLPRRTRHLSLNGLIAGALILYPRYVHHRTGKLTTPEHALDALLSWRKNSTQRAPWWRAILKIALRFLGKHID
ncbi:MAG: beta-3-deoxy-D-manno-oct-2-ulosonic acid transferase [Ottowia sp.]|nr:beta-3-deoxy-D-manno-oct-2-ulosonic acid transferase [Ottowia sp.]